MATARCRAAVFAVLAMGWLAAAPPAPAGEPEGAPEGDVSDPSGSDPLFEEEPEEYEAPPPVPDPLEEGNRAIFAFNQKLDAWFWSPVTRAYRLATPEFFRTGVRRALHNLNTPVFVANELFQLRLRDAAQTLGAFALNSTLGVFGIFEPGKEAGWEVRNADFGQTLALVGVGSGPYVVVPVLGPTTVRDGMGNAVDYFLQPLNYVLGVPTQLVWGGSAGLSVREQVADELKALEKSSIDFYAVMRSAYHQSREQEIADARSRRDADLERVRPKAWRCGAHAAVGAQD